MIAQKIKSKVLEDCKCGGCNWVTETYYSMLDEDIVRNEDGYSNGLCSQCFLEMLMEMQDG